ncbi:MAG: SET domain-containing protein-lysine N-methyltransferase [Verrucomicrobiales bacterium]|nr:SET domain-containing protein-lysine N-methyltransferase [Verrucomicrobiales bacterium]
MSKKNLCDSEWCEIRESPIHGRGLYATKNIPNETYVIEYVGERVDKEESDRRGWDRIGRAKETGEAAVYIFTLNDEWDIDGSVEENAARLINHSCAPNCEAYICGEEDEEQSIWICAIRDIKKGEELFFNYGFDLESFEDHPCYCGAKSCVGYIVGEDYWGELKQKLADGEFDEAELAESR